MPPRPQRAASSHRASDEAVQLPDLLELDRFVTGICDHHVGPGQDLHRLVRALVEPHRPQRLREVVRRIVDAVDRAAQGRLRGPREPRARHRLHRQPRFELRPEPADVGDVNQQERRGVEVQQVHIGQRRPELPLLGLGPLPLRQAPVVEPHKPQGGVGRQVLPHPGELKAGRVRVPWRLPSVAHHQQLPDPAAVDRILQAHGDLREPARMLAPEPLESGQRCAGGGAEIRSPQAPEDAQLALLGLLLDRTDGLRCHLH
mmetsp:Transcript_42616/g.132963  ORF Transcript_42616/g.132963 Transcript_42616/m.132963 type:complete len:259 (+) Transcript_42616:168-944(+)